MTDASFFSIITITKDNAAGLGKTQESVSMQSLRDFEWIVVNGGKALQNIFADILIEEPDNGIYDAMNKGLGAATGQYIVFLNAGDRFSDPDILSTIKRAANFDDPDILYGDALEEGLSYKKARHHKKIDRGMITHHQSIYYKRGLIEDMRYDTSYKIAADYDFTRKALKSAKNIHYCPAALCLFEAGGVSEQNRKEGRKEEFIIRKKNGVSTVMNIFVTARQFLAATIREKSPRLYQALRRV